MRLWHYSLLPYLPDSQFKGQLRELVAIMQDWREKGKTNHLLINKVMEYPRDDLYGFFLEYAVEYEKRYNKRPKHTDEFIEFGNHRFSCRPFSGWHDKEYLRVCVCNLYEKYRFGVGSSKITDEEWEKIMDGYFTITGEEWRL